MRYDEKHRESLSKSIKNWWASKSPEERLLTQKKISAGTKVWWDAHPDEKKKKIASQMHTPEVRAKVGKMRLGVPMTGEAAKGPTHFRSSAGTLRDSRGVTWDFKNLLDWSREHLHLFEYEDPISETVKLRRVRTGLGRLCLGFGASYKGWTVVQYQSPSFGATAEGSLAEKSGLEKTGHCGSVNLVRRV